MLKVCFDFNRNRTISACNMLFNVFSDAKVHSYLEEQINKLWDELKEDKEKFFPFFKAFHMIRPTETLILLKERIENEPAKEFDASTIEFKDDNDCMQITDENITILCSFNNTNQLPEAIELLIEYYIKRPDLFEEVYTAFVREFGIDKDSAEFDYYSITTAIEYLCNHIKTSNNNNSLLLFVRVATYYLKFVVSRAEGGRRNTFTLYTIPVTATPKVIKYRKVLLNELKNIYYSGKYNREIEMVLKNYCTGNTDYIDYEIVKEEYNDILSFLYLLNTDNLYHCSIVEHIKWVFEKAKIEYEQTIINTFIESPKNKIFYTLKGDRKDYLSMSQDEEDQHRRLVVENLIKDYTLSDFDFLFQVSIEVENQFVNSSYHFSTGLGYVFDIISKDNSLYLKIVESYFHFDTPCNIFPVYIIKKLFKVMSADKVKRLIEKYDFSQKNTWLWYFYVELPEKYIKKEYVDEILIFLSETPAKLKSAGYRHLECIKKYEVVDNEIFSKASRTILDNCDKSPFAFDLYFRLLFNPAHISPQDLIALYSFDEFLLANIYLKCISYSEHFDYNGVFLMEIIKVIPDFIDVYLNQIVQQSNYKYRKYEGYMKRLRKTWKEQDYIDKIDNIIEMLFSMLQDRRWYFTNCVQVLFALKQNDDEVIIKQDEWINRCIENKYGNVDFMSALFEIISDFSADRRRNFLLKFVSLNSNYDDFEKIPLEPSSWGGSGSMIPYMQKRITYLSSLIPYLSGVKYLKHKHRIEYYIDVWKERIKQEEIRELLDEWF